MPATRSRTANWHHSLQQLHERNGALEISLPAFADAGSESGGGSNLIWRVRILELSEAEILVELPCAMGQEIRLQDGIELVGIVAIGQNRWMFKTVTLGLTHYQLNGHRSINAMRLRMPVHVERCQRRQFYRVTTVGLTLPEVDCYPLLDPLSSVVAETANRLEIQRLIDKDIAGKVGGKAGVTDPDTLPQVGPRAKSILVNIGGGGVGLLLEPENRPMVDSHRVYWLRVNLMPQIPAPLGVTARLRHTHIDSAQRIYAGMAFDFGHSAEHQQFVVDQICRYAMLLQREQLRRASQKGNAEP